MPVPVLVGATRKAPGTRSDGCRHPLPTDLDAALNDTANVVYFDAQITGRPRRRRDKAIAIEENISKRKTDGNFDERAYALYESQRRGVNMGWCRTNSGCRSGQLRTLIDQGFFGEILSVRGVGYGFFEGNTVTAQRPSWNYRKEDDGGIIVDMLCHGRYVLDNCSEKLKRSVASGRRTSGIDGTTMEIGTSARPTTARTRPFNSPAA